MKELAGQNTLNERPILCNFFLNNNLPLWSQWTPRKVKSPAYIYFAAPIFRKPPSMMSQRDQDEKKKSENWCDADPQMKQKAQI